MNNELLTACRIIAGYKTKKQLAEDIGVHPATITRWEAGTVPVTKETEIKLIQVLNEKGLSQEQIQLISQIKKGE